MRLDILTVRDAFVYALSLYALHRSANWRAGAALTKGVIMAAFGIGVVVEAVFKLSAGVVPEGSLMGIFVSGQIIHAALR